MRHRLHLLPALLSLALIGALFMAILVGTVCSAAADDRIFPPSAAAKPFIDFDGRGFLLNGKRTFLASGSLHYSRVPRALWRDRLLRFKRAGFNTVQTYAFWNYHEPREGQWNFSGDHDLDAFLKLIKELGMFAVVRVGPYVCAEWDSGGYPVWLRFKPGVRVREDNPQFEAFVDRWYDHVMPIVARNQIHRGGAVIMVQLENEHPQGWGRDLPNGYFRHLREKALALGLEVPYFFSGLHHGDDPAGSKPWDSVGRDSPWYSTEFWPGWYDLYGNLDAGRFSYFNRGTWKIIAYGGNGYNYYMLHGGTNFDTWNDDEVGACYDYGAAIGQSGDLRPIYYRFKRAAMFATSFADVLEDSASATEQYKDAVTATDLHITARKSPAGTLLFLDNQGKETIKTQLRPDLQRLLGNSTLSVQPDEFRPIALNYKLLPDLTLAFAAARILGIARQGETTTLVVYGVANLDADKQEPQSPPAAPDLKAPEEDSGEMVFTAAADITAHGGSDIVRADARRVELRPRFPSSGVREAWFTVGKQRVRVLTVCDQIADETWFIPVGERSDVVIGVPYVGEALLRDGRLHLSVERPYISELQDDSEMTPQLYGPEGGAATLKETPPPEADLTSVSLGPWAVRTGAASAAPGAFTANWKSSPSPLPMGADGDISAYAWYRTSVFVARGGDYLLRCTDAGDWVAAWANGSSAGFSKVTQRFDHPQPREFALKLHAGANSLALLCAHYGRHKLFNYLGPIDRIDAKGLSGPVTLSRQTAPDVAVGNWRWRPWKTADPAPPITGPLKIEPGTDGWTDIAAAEDVFHGRHGFAWFRTALPPAPGPHRALLFESVDDNAVVWLNGKLLTSHKGWNLAFRVLLDAAWHSAGPNELTVLVENTDGPGGIMGAVTLQSRAPGDDAPVLGWKMRGGPGDPADPAATWKAGSTTTAPGEPTFYRTEFVSAVPGKGGAVEILRFNPAGLSRGFVWLNGHNLGRYPERTPAGGLYLPECWIRPGKNTLIIFDEEGRAPGAVRLETEAAAGRTVVEMTEP